MGALDKLSLGSQIGAAAGLMSALFLVGVGFYGSSQAERQVRELTLVEARQEAVALVGEIDSSYSTSRE